MATYAATAVGSSSNFPVNLVPPSDLGMSRLWGIPLVGYYVRIFLAIPQFLIMAVLAIGMYVIFAIGWIPILLLGRVPDIQRRWLQELIHRGARVSAYIFLLPGGYPAWGVGEPGPVDVQFDLEDRRINRLWGVPLLGIMARFIAAIPHLFVLGVLAACCGLLMLVIWIPILITGRYPSWAMTLFAGMLRYNARLQAYLFLLPVPYPPFTLD